MAHTTLRSPYLTALDARVLVIGGSSSTILDTLGLTAADYGGPATEGCCDYLIFTRPDLITYCYTRFLEVGVDAIGTRTFQSSRLRLDEWGLGDQTYAINYRVARLCRTVVDSFTARDGRQRFVTGSIGPTGKLPSLNDPLLSDIGFGDLVAVFAEQAHALIAGGVDVLLIETSQDMLEVKAAVLGCRQAIAAAGQPIVLQVQVTLDSNERMLLGTDIASMLTTIVALDVDVVGLNCSTGPEQMRAPIRYLTTHTTLPISCVPNAGIPTNVNGQAVYPLHPDTMAHTLGAFVRDFGVRVVGGCCGSTPDHMRAIVNVVRQTRAGHPQPVLIPHSSSGIRAVALRHELCPRIVGTRLSSSNQQVNRLLLIKDDERLLELAHTQVQQGAHLLSINMPTLTGSDDAVSMVRLIKLLSLGVDAPLVLASRDAALLEVALQVYPGRPILDGAPLDALFALAARYGAAVICRVEAEYNVTSHLEAIMHRWQRIYDLATSAYGLPPDALIIAVPTSPLITAQEGGRTAALWTLEALRLIKQELPDVLTCLDMSILTHDATSHARMALTSVFLEHATAVGLDLALVDPQHLIPTIDLLQSEYQLCDDLLFNRHPEALTRFLQYYEDHASARIPTPDTPENLMLDIPVTEAITQRIIQHQREGIEALLDQALVTQTAVDILNHILLPAMKTVGDMYGAGTLALPFVLQSTEVMKRAVTHLEPYLAQQTSERKGTVVLATVEGDVHDIGKNLVGTILSNNGYTIHDLGKQVPLETIIEQAVSVQADIIGLSAMLVSTSRQMALCVEALRQRNLCFPVLIGGASISPRFAQQIMVGTHTVPYEGGVFYCKDAFEGLATVDRLSNPSQREAAILEIRQAAASANTPPSNGRTPAINQEDGSVTQRRSRVAQDVPIPLPPFWGARIERQIDFDVWFDCLDRNALYRLQWGAKNASGAAWEHLQTEYAARLHDLRAEAERDGWLQPVIAYGYYPVQSDGDTVIVYDPATLEVATVIADVSADTSHRSSHPPRVERTRLHFPRQSDGERLCLADYIAGVERGCIDVAAFQVVTVGAAVAQHVAWLHQRDDYSQSYYIHGLGVALAEALAEYGHRLIRRELRLHSEQGRRYAWGYPACPDLAEQARLACVLPLEDIGIRFTSAYQLVPEYSTSAFIVHHPEAKYFSMRV